jgi:hypothetical protein
MMTRARGGEHDLGVVVFDVIDHSCQKESAVSGAITFFSQALPEPFIGNQALNGSRQCSSVARPKQKPVLLVRDNLGNRP